MNNFFQEERENLIKLLIDLVKEDTTNDGDENLGNEYLAAKYVKAEFEKLNIPYEVFEKEKGRTNVIGKIGNRGPSIFLAAHLDVVPAGEGWIYPPFEPTIKGDRMWGRGVLDDKGLMASLLVMAKYLKKIEDKLNITVLIGAVADEERGSEFGMTYLADNGLVKADYAIIPDNAGNMQEINIAEKGNVAFKVKSKGLQAHAMAPQNGVNAILHLSRFLLELEKYEFTYEEHDLLSPPTMNIGLIKGGNVLNSVPNYAEAQVEVRYLPSQNGEDIVNDIRKIVDRLKLEHKDLDIELEIVSISYPIALDPNNIIVATIKEEAEGFHKKEVRLTGMGGGTVCKDLMRNGCKALCFSAGDDEFYHQVNENISITELVDFSNIITRVILKLNDNYKLL